MLFEGTAWAQAAAGTPADNPSFVQQLMTGPGPIMALVVAVMYFLVFRPQNKKAQEQAKMLSALKRNDEVVTTGGIIGGIPDAGGKVITLEVATHVSVRAWRSQITGRSPQNASATKDDTRN